MKVGGANPTTSWMPPDAVQATDEGVIEIQEVREKREVEQAQEVAATQPAAQQPPPSQAELEQQYAMSTQRLAGLEVSPQLMHELLLQVPFEEEVLGPPPGGNSLWVENQEPKAEEVTKNEDGDFPTAIPGKLKPPHPNYQDLLEENPQAAAAWTPSSVPAAAKPEHGDTTMEERIEFQVGQIITVCFDDQGKWRFDSSFETGEARKQDVEIEHVSDSGDTVKFRLNGRHWYVGTRSLENQNIVIFQKDKTTTSPEIQTPTPSEEVTSVDSLFDVPPNTIEQAHAEAGKEKSEAPEEDAPPVFSATGSTEPVEHQTQPDFEAPPASHLAAQQAAQDPHPVAPTPQEPPPAVPPVEPARKTAAYSEADIQEAVEASETQDQTDPETESAPDESPRPEPLPMTPPELPSTEAEDDVPVFEAGTDEIMAVQLTLTEDEIRNAITMAVSEQQTDNPVIYPANASTSSMYGWLCFIALAGTIALWSVFNTSGIIKYAATALTGLTPFIMMWMTKIFTDRRSMAQQAALDTPVFPTGSGSAFATLVISKLEGLIQMRPDEQAFQHEMATDFASTTDEHSPHVEETHTGTRVRVTGEIDPKQATGPIRPDDYTASQDDPTIDEPSGEFKTVVVEEPAPEEDDDLDEDLLFGKPTPIQVNNTGNNKQRLRDRARSYAKTQTAATLESYWLRKLALFWITFSGLMGFYLTYPVEAAATHNSTNMLLISLLIIGSGLVLIGTMANGITKIELMVYVVWGAMIMVPTLINLQKVLVALEHVFPYFLIAVLGYPITLVFKSVLPKQEAERL